MVAYPGHILESTKWIVIQFDTYVDVNEGSTENNNHSPRLHFT